MYGTSRSERKIIVVIIAAAESHVLDRNPWSRAHTPVAVGAARRRVIKSRNGQLKSEKIIRI
jgi:hypothetical protein